MTTLVKDDDAQLQSVVINGPLLSYRFTTSRRSVQHQATTRLGCHPPSLMPDGPDLREEKGKAGKCERW
jgi:hypothetical protein